MDELYRINDVLTQLAEELGAWPDVQDDDKRDELLNDLTHEVAKAFQIK
jgi:hypothetical protein